MAEKFKNIRDDLGKLKTEGRNQNTLHIDTMSTIEMMTVMNNENRVVEDAIATQLSEISQAVDIIATALGESLSKSTFTESRICMERQIS